MYLLDTDVIIDHLRGKKEIPEEIATQKIGMSIISYGELLFGVEKSINPPKTYQIITDFINAFSLEIVNLNKDSIGEFAKLKTRLEKSGKRLDDFDLLIAATAKQYSLILVTGNRNHFERISDLKIFR